MRRKKPYIFPIELKLGEQSSRKLKKRIFQGTESSTRGGYEPPLLVGHLGGGEPIVKPTLKGRFYVFIKGVAVLER